MKQACYFVTPIPSWYILFVFILKQAVFLLDVALIIPQIKPGQYPVSWPVLQRLLRMHERNKANVWKLPPDHSVGGWYKAWALKQAGIAKTYMLHMCPQIFWAYHTLYPETMFLLSIHHHHDFVPIHGWRELELNTTELIKK